MGEARQPERVKLFCGLLGAGEDVLAEARQRLSARYGEPDVAGSVAPFDYTSYYEPEMGPGLLRQYLAFADLIEPGQLAAIKLQTNELEREMGVVTDGVLRRRVNLDPGYLTPAKLVLATVKNSAQRVYLRDGIFAEVTVNFGSEGCRYFPWTYADYRSSACAEVLLAARRKLMQQRTHQGCE